MTRVFAAIGVIVAAQVAWWSFMTHAASLEADITVHGAYAALWALGVPIVFLVSVLLTAMLFAEK